MRKKVLFMLSSMNIGGVEKSFLSLVSRLNPEKYDITLLFLDKKGGFLESVPSYVKVEECQWFKEIKSILMNSPYDIIKRYKEKRRYFKIIRFIFSYYMTKFTQNRLFYFKESQDKISIFKNILNPILIKKMAEEKIEDIETEEETLKIVTLGRLGKEKGQDLGIKALQLLKEKGLKVKWYFIGDGLARKEYEELIKNLKLEKEAIFLGNKINPYSYIKMADIYVQTSRHEGYCIALAEAKILNKKIVTTSFTGASEELKDYGEAIICQAKEEEIYKGILELIN